MPSGHSPGEYH